MESITRKRVLLTAARSFIALDLARKLHAAGHQVFVADSSALHMCRFSNTVAESIVLPSPRLHPKAFVDTLIHIVTEKKIDYVIPIYEEILYLSKEAPRFPAHCTLFSSPFQLLNQLHNKWLFYELLRSLEIEAPRTYLIHTEEELKNIKFSKPYILKACYSRASLNIKKVDPKSPLPKIEISSLNPWVAQEWLEGKKYCSYSICHNGVVKAQAVYPVTFAIDGNSCLSFESVEHPEIVQWIEKLVKCINFTGQIAFDFIELPNKKLHAIECNPRATSGAHLFSCKDRLDRAFFNTTDSPIYARIGNKRQIATAMLIYGWKKSSRPSKSIKAYFKALFGSRDVIFCLKDIKPFLAEPLMFMKFWCDSKKLNLSFPAVFTFDNEWNGES